MAISVTKPVTYGEFVDTMRKVAESVDHAEILFEEWINIEPTEPWEELRTMPVGEGEVRNFVEDMVTSFRELVEGTCLEDLHATRINDGHTFLLAIHSKLAELGIVADLGDVNVPLSPSDALRMAQSVKGPVSPEDTVGVGPEGLEYHSEG